MELTDVLPFQAEPRVSKTSPVLKTALELYGSSLAVLSITVDELGAAMDPYSKLIPTSFLSPPNSGFWRPRLRCLSRLGYP